MSSKEQALVTRLKLDSSQFDRNLGNATKAVAGIAGAFASVKLSVGNLAKEMAQYQDTQMKASRSAGVAVEQFSALNYAAGQSGVSTDHLAKVMGKLSDPAGAAASSMAKLGISATDANGKAKDSTKLFAELADKIKNTQDPADKTALAIKVLGKEGGQMVSMLDGGAAGLSRLTAEAERLGITVDTKAGQAAEKFNDSLDRMKKSVKGLGNQFSQTIIRMANESGILDLITDTIAGVTQWWRELGDGTKEVIVTIMQAAGAFVTLLSAGMAVKAALPLIMAAAKAVGASMTVALGPIGLIVAAIAALVYGAIKYSDELKKAFLPVTREVGKVFDEIKIGIDKFLGVVKEISGDLFKDIKDFFGSIGDGAKEVDILGTVFKVVFNIIGSLITAGIAMAKNMVNGYIMLGQVIKGIATAVYELATMSPKKALQALKRMKNDVVNTGKEIFETSKSAYEDIKKIWSEPIVYKANTDALDEANKKAKAGTESTRAGVRQASKEMEHETVTAYNNMLDGANKFAQNPTIETFGAMQKAAADFGMAVLSVVSTFTDAIAGIADANAAAIGYASKVTQRDMQVTMLKMEQAHKAAMETLTANEDKRLEELKKQHQKEIDAVSYAEREKSFIIEHQASIRKALADDEFRAKKEAAEKEFEAWKETERKKFEAEKELKLAKTIDLEQRLFAELLLEEDFRNYMANMEAEHTSDMNQMAIDYSNQVKQIDIETKTALTISDEESKAAMQTLQEQHNAAIEQAEKDRNDKISQLQIEQSEKEKKHRKEMIRKQWLAEVDQFNATKAAKIAQTVVQGSMAAMGAMAAMSMIPIVGPALGAAAAATIAVFAGKQIQAISRERPVKPAELYMERGGLVPGNRSHARGGVMAELESGEYVLNQQDTQKIRNSIMQGNGKTINITFAPNSIVNAPGNSNQDLFDMIRWKLGEAMASERVYAGAI